MSETFFEKWKHRIYGAWDVLTGRAYAGYLHEMPCDCGITANGLCPVCMTYAMTRPVLSTPGEK